MDLNKLRRKTRTILRRMVGQYPTQLGKGASSIYETLILSKVIVEYVRLNGKVSRVVLPTSGRTNLGGAYFNVKNSYEIEFLNGEIFYFAQNIYVHGLPNIYGYSTPDHFEVDVIVLKGKPTPNPGCPSPIEIDSVYECKFGAYKKAHLRELLGIKRHLTFCGGFGSGASNNYPFNIDASGSNPDIPVILFRPPNSFHFFSSDYKEFFNVGAIDYI